MFSPMTRASMSFMPSRCSENEKTCGSRTCWRLYARNWRVSVPPLSTALVMDAGKAPDGFHLLRVAQSVFDSPYMRDVFGDYFQIEHFPGVMPHRAPADRYVDALASLLPPMRPQPRELLPRSGLVKHERRVLALFEDVGCQVHRQQFLRGVVPEHSHQRVIDYQQLAFRHKNLDWLGNQFCAVITEELPRPQ